MTGVAAAAGTGRERIRDAATAGNDDKPAKTTVLRYLDTLERLWVIEPIPAWTPARNNLARLALSPKHQLADPALAARLRGATVDTLLEGSPAGPLAPRDATLFGALFESLVALDVRTYAQAAEARVSHFRTRDGDHEVTLIVDRTDQRVVAIEVKLARTVTDEHVRHLLWLRGRMGEDLLDPTTRVHDLLEGRVRRRGPRPVQLPPGSLPLVRRRGRGPPSPFGERPAVPPG